MSSEVSVAVNLKNKFIPTIEFGMGGTDTWSETGIHYKSKMAPFFRIGVDYNTMAKKKEKNSYLYAGLRYAFSSFKYDVSTMPADDPIWGDVIGNPSLEDGYWGGSVPFSHLGMKGSVQWLEIVLGVKVRIYKNFNMGWSVPMGEAFVFMAGSPAAIGLVMADTAMKSASLSIARYMTPDRGTSHSNEVILAVSGDASAAKTAVLNARQIGLELLIAMGSYPEIPGTPYL